MPIFAANLTMMFTEYPLLERFAAAKKAGFDVVEILFPYDDAPKLVARQLLIHDLTLALINCPPPNYTGGAPGYAAIPEQQNRFRRDFARTLRYAAQLKPTHIHVMAGKAYGRDARLAFVENLKWACGQAPDQSLTIEPISQAAQPGYFLSDYDEAAAIIAEVDMQNLGLQYDAYHAQLTTGDAIAVWTKHKKIIHHIQVAAIKGRHEPDAAEIDYPALFALLDADEYEGFVAGEYTPKSHTEDGLDWIRPT